MQEEKEVVNLKCPICTNKGVYYRANKEKHFKCKKCGNEFNIKV